MLRVAFALIAVCVCLTVVAAQQPTKPAVTMDDIKKVWQERQDKVKTLKMTWKRTDVRPKGSMDLAVPFYHDDKIKTPQPPRDMRLTGEATLTLSKGRFRYAHRSETWSITDNAVKPFSQTAVYDGEEYRQQESHVSDPEKEQAAIQSPARAMMIEPELLELKPIFWCAHGAKGPSGFDPLADYEVTGRSVTSVGRVCVELESKSRTSGTLNRLLLISGSYLPQSLSVMRNGKLRCQLDIEYGLIGSNLVPDRWRYTSKDSAGHTEGSLEATVTACEIGGPVGDETFRLSYRAGSVVVDLRDKTERLAVVLPDGTISESVERRSVGSREELIAATKPRVSRWWWLAGAVFCVIAAVAVYLIRRRRVRPA